jgi:hypothetical protein
MSFSGLEKSNIQFRADIRLLSGREIEVTSSPRMKRLS